MAAKTRTAIAAAAVVCLSASCATADDNPIRGVAKLLGFATDAGAGADFVEKTRPAKEPDFIPVFRPPPEPARPILNPQQLNTLKGDLDSTEKSHDALRAGFPPAAKAMAEEAAKAKSAAKTAPAKPEKP